MVAQSLVPIHTPITPAQAAQSELFSAEGRVAVSPPKTEPGNRLIRREKKAIAEVPDSLDQAGSSDLWQSITSTASLARAGEALSQANRERAARQRSERREGEHADKIMQSTGLTGATRGLEVALIAVVLQMNAQFFAAVALVMQRMASDDRAMSVLRQVGIITYLVTSIPDMLSFFSGTAKRHYVTLPSGSSGCIWIGMDVGSTRCGDVQFPAYNGYLDVCRWHLGLRASWPQQHLDPSVRRRGRTQHYLG